MDSIRKLYVRISERPRGQTMSEYALIVAVLSIVVFGSYKTIGLTLQSLISNVEALL
ncbi:MAG TPA: Flp family type IVb pilin [Candidatus Binataceae bacterium]|nr:Flp family type IVb pilin [Candidatus Binataceae bacterium]